MSRSRLLNVRVSDEQRDRWQAEADARGLSLSQYVKDAVEAVSSTPEPDEVEVTGGDLLEGHADGQIEGQAALEPPSEAGPEGQPEGHAETGGPMQPPDWRPTSEAMRLKIIQQRDRPPGYSDDEWVGMSPLARAARAAEAGRR